MLGHELEDFLCSEARAGRAQDSADEVDSLFRRRGFDNKEGHGKRNGIRTPCFKFCFRIANAYNDVFAIYSSNSNTGPPLQV